MTEEKTYLWHVHRSDVRGCFWLAGSNGLYALHADIQFADGLTMAQAKEAVAQISARDDCLLEMLNVDVALHAQLPASIRGVFATPH